MGVSRYKISRFPLRHNVIDRNVEAWLVLIKYMRVSVTESASLDVLA